MNEKLTDDFVAEFQKIRQHFHAHPETAYEENETSKFIADYLKNLGLPVTENLGKTGLVAHLKRSDSAPLIGLRADMDALPIEEKSGKSYASQNAGKMHACGHDGHMAMLLCAAKFLTESKDFKGNIAFIFQPAEEGFAGAQAMIDDGLFEKFPCRAVFGIHNWPGIPAGKMMIFPGPMMAGNCHIAFDFKGRGCHAAMPFQGDDVILAASNFVAALQGFVQRQKSAQNPVVLSITQFHAGDALNVLPDTARLAGALRFFDNALLENVMLPKIRQMAQGIAAAFGVEVVCHLDPFYPPTINEKRAAAFAQKVAQKAFGEENVFLDPAPTMGSEDFAFMLQKVAGCYAWLGNGDSAPLHNPRYDFNDEILGLGARYFVELAFSTVNAEFF